MIKPTPQMNLTSSRERGKPRLPEHSPPCKHPSRGGVFSWRAVVAFPPDLLFLDMPQFKSLRVTPSPPPPQPQVAGFRGARGCAAGLQCADACGPSPAAPHRRRLGMQGTPCCVPTSIFPLHPGKTPSSKNCQLHKGFCPPPCGPRNTPPLSNPRPQLMAISVAPICRNGSSTSCCRSHRAVMGPATFPSHRDANGIPLCHLPSPAQEGERQLGRPRENSQFHPSWKESLPLLQGFNLHFPGMD